jgi:hypothetical protein
MAGRGRCLVAGVVALVMVAGCSSSEQPAAEQVASDFSSALARGDTVRACGLLTPATRATLELDESQPCPTALAKASLPATGQIIAASVWSGAAQIRTSGDTLFATRTSAGWRIAAAGCRPQGEAPYHCVVEGP